MVNVNNFSDLNSVLRNSFQAIKRDMLQLKEAQLVQIRGAKALNQNLSGFRDDFVTKDQYNLLRVKMGDLNEEFKELTRIKDDVVRVENKLEEEINRLAGETPRKEDYKVEYGKHTEDITDLKRRTQDITKELKKSAKEIRFKQLVAEIKQEFSTVRKEINYVERTGGSVVEDKFKHYISSLNNKIGAIEANIKRLEQYSKIYVNTAQAEELVQDVNIEFDKVKDGVDLLEKKQKQYLLKDDFEKKITEREKAYDQRIKDFNYQISKIEKELLKQKTFVTETQAEILVGDINKEFDNINDKIVEVNGIRKDLKRFVDKEDVEKQVDRFGNTVGKLTDSFDAFRKSSLSNERLAREVKELKKGVNESVEISDYEKETKRFDNRIKQLSNKIDDIVPVSRHEKEISRIDFEINKLKSGMKSTVDGARYEREISKLNSQVYNLKEDIEEIKQHIKQIAKASGKGPVELKIKVRRAGFFARWRAKRAAKKAHRRLEKLKDRKLKEAERLAKLRQKESSRFANSRKVKAKELKAKKIKVKKPLRKTYIFANTLIFLAFCLLGGSLASFAYDAPDMMDILALSAIIVFILGIILRLFVIIKRR